MADKKANLFPMPSVMRLPVYLKFARELYAEGETVVSCTKIADEFGQSSVQVRKDLALTKIAGRPRVGYPLKDLIGRIESFLGWNQKICAFLVGVGGLGSAVLGYADSANFGLEIVAAFDSDPQKIGKMVHGHKINSVDEVETVGQRVSAAVGILTVPADSAQDAADRLVSAGVRGIWNFTPCRLALPANIVCQTVRLSGSFALLSCRMTNTSRN